MLVVSRATGPSVTRRGSAAALPRGRA
jgi:hypothetical protein